MAIDVGTGDGRFVVHMARRHPDWLWVGLDAARDALAAGASRAAKAEPGGLPNALFVAGTVAAPPPELAGAADLVTVHFPWGALLRAVLLPEAPVLAAVARLGRPGAAFRVCLNTTVFRPPVPRALADLPAPTGAYVDAVLAPAYARAGVTLTRRRVLGRAELARWPSSWARRLAGHTGAAAVLLSGVVTGDGRPARPGTPGRHAYPR